MTVSAESVIAARRAESLLDRVKRHEGWRPRPYKCTAGKLTVGYGFNLEDRDLPQSIASLWLAYLLQDAELRLHHLGLLHWVLSDVQKEVIVEMMFQLGAPRFMSFVRMCDCLRRGAVDYVPVEMLDSKWAREDCPSRARELADLFRTG